MSEDKKTVAKDVAVETFLANSLISMLRTHDKGRAIGLIESDLREVVTAVKSIGKGGKLTLTISIKPLDKEGDQVSVELDSKVNCPKPEAKPSLYFITRESGLSRNHPDQLSLFTNE